MAFPPAFLRTLLPELVPLRHHGSHEVIVLVLPLGGEANRVGVDVAAGREESLKVSTFDFHYV